MVDVLKMVLAINTKSRRRFFRYSVSFISYLFLGVALVTVYRKAESLHNMERSLDLKLKKIAISEERLQKLHQNVHRSMRSRHRREVVRSNVTNDDLNDIQDHVEDVDINTERPSCNNKCGTMGGAIYTRWGRKNCSDESELVYEGVVGGSNYDQPGGAVDHLCLPRFPLWNSYEDGIQGFAYLVGTEYDSSHLESIFSLKNARKLSDENVPCAVCRSISRQSVIMIPARNLCYQGWNLEYHGYLLAGHCGHNKGTMYICVDEAPEVTEGGYRNENGNLLYQVEGSCGSLPCPEYIHGREITCAVCTK